MIWMKDKHTAQLWASKQTSTSRSEKPDSLYFAQSSL